MNRYIAKDGERLDKVIYSHYGTLEVFHTVLAVNAHLLGRTLLSTGDVVYLPFIKAKPQTRELRSLWS